MESGTGHPTSAFAADTVLSSEIPQDHSPVGEDMVQLLSESVSSWSSESEDDNSEEDPLALLKQLTKSMLTNQKQQLKEWKRLL